MRPHQVNTGIRAFAGDHQAFSGAAPGKTVRGPRELEGDGRSALLDAGDVSAMGAARFFGEIARHDRDARLAQPGIAAAADPRVRVFERGDDPGHARCEDRIGAGRRLAVVGARLERDVERRSLGRRAGRLERDALGVRPPARLRDALGDDAAIAVGLVDDNGSDGRVWPGQAEMALAQSKREPREPFILRMVACKHPRRGAGERVHELDRDVAGLARSAASSPGSSLASCPMISSKSLASRKSL